MTELRDARLQRALRDAPDAHMAPSSSTRAAILARAHEAVTPTRAAPWWKRLGWGAGSQRMPWNAAFATIVVASLVTVMWHDRDIPDARTEGGLADKQAPAAVAPPVARGPVHQAPAVTAQPQPAPPEAARAPAPKTAEVPAPRKDAARKAEPVAPAVAPAPAPAPAPAAAPPPISIPAPAAPAQAPPPPVVAEAPAAAADAQRERRAEVATGALRDESRGALAKSASPDARQAGTSERAAAGLARPAAPAPQANAPAAAMAPPAQSGASGLAAGLNLQVSAPPGTWTDVVLSGAGRTVQLPAAQASRLIELARQTALDARSTEPLREPVTHRIELRRQGQVEGLLELAGRQVRWTQLRGGENRVTTGEPDAARLDALREEFRRLAER